MMAEKCTKECPACFSHVHNYGQQTTIGTIEHLKNPSLVEIRKYYNKYYVPNNMAIIFAGDFDPDEMIKKVDQHFAYMQPKPVELYNPAPEKPLTKIQKVDVYGPSAEGVQVFYRGSAENTKQSLMLDLVSSILFNRKAGLFDINLNKQQKVLSANAGYMQMKDYGILYLMSTPKEGQSLETVKNLLMEQIDLLKKGEFDASLINATVANNKLSLLQQFDKNDFRVEAATNEFILNRGTKWDQSLNAQDAMAKITKQEIVDFANQFFADNYVVGYKHKGEDKNILKVEKPVITPINPNANMTSAFTKSIIEDPVKPISPQFLDYKKDLNFGKLGIADVVTVQNKDNSIFQLTYRFDMGAYNYKLLPYAAQYLNFLSTDKYTAEEISKEFYNIACTYNMNVGNDIVTINISGLQENFEKAVRLVEHVFANSKANENALTELKSTILKARQNAKLNKATILNGLVAYAQYGAVNPTNNVLTNEEVNQITSKELMYILHNLNNYAHTITYYGPKPLAAFTADLKKLHVLPQQFTPAAPAMTYKYTATTNNNVLFADYDMVQSEIRWVRNDGKYDPALRAKIDLFNNYFGAGMGSIVFQTLRESKALAYSTYAFYLAPDKASKEFMMTAYIGSQADKMNDAVNGMNELLTDLPQLDKSFDGAKNNSLNAIEIGRITNNSIIQAYFADKKMGFEEDSRIALYNSLKPLTFANLKDFHKTHVANKPYTYCIIGAENKIKLEDMQKFGTVTKLTLEQIFGY